MIPQELSDALDRLGVDADRYPLEDRTPMQQDIITVMKAYYRLSSPCDRGEGVVAWRADDGRSARRAVDACGGSYSAEEEASGYAQGHRDALEAAMKAVEPIDAMFAASLDLHGSDCATHNEPAYPNGPCDCAPVETLTPEDIKRARELRYDPDSEDNERFASWYGDALLAVHDAYVALIARPTLPEGWVAVPVEATEEMIEAAYNEWLNSGALSGRDVIREIFRAMLSALPLPFGGGEVIGSLQLSAKASVPGEPVTANVDDRKDASGETVMGMRVAAYRHPMDCPPDIDRDKWLTFFRGSPPNTYSEHWSTPGAHRTDVERLFTEADVRAALEASQPGTQSDGGQL